MSLSGCASAGQFVWIDALTPEQLAPPQVSFVIGPEDVVVVQVFNHPEMSGRSRVRSDGKLSIGLLGDVMAAGRAPSVLASDIASQLGEKRLAVDASVTVAIDETAPVRIAMIGEVARPGLHTLAAGSGLSEAIASAGGFTNFAHKDRLFVLRQTPELLRIRFTFDDVARGTRGALRFRLRTGDTIVAE